MPDPYGYSEPAPLSTGSATQALYAGVFALICAAIAPCLCYMPYLMALPLGGYAMYAGSQVRGGGDALSTSESTMATGGMIAGAVASMLSLTVLLLVVGYFILVFGMMALGAANQ